MSTLTAPRPLPFRETASLLGRLVLAAVLLVASLAKITDPAATVRAVRAYRLLPEPLAVAVGHTLPSVELALAALLLVGFATRWAARLTAVLLAVFVAGIVSADARGLAIDCGCFGGGGATADPHYTGEILRDLALLGVAVVVAVAPRSLLALDPAGPRTSPAGGPAAAKPGAARQARVAATRAAERQAEMRTVTRRNALLALGGVVAVGAVGAVASRTPAPSVPVATPPGVTAAGGVLVGQATATHHLVLFEDPQCPVCGQFEKTGGASVRAAVDAGTLQVEYRMRSFLGAESRRAVAALGAAQAGGRFADLRAALFAHQPEERTGGFTLDTLVGLGAGVGLTDDAYVTAVRAQTYAPWADAVDDRASRDGDTGTPELRLDGVTLTSAVVFDPTQLAALLA